MKNDWFTVKKLVPNIWGIAEFGHFEKIVSYLIVGKKSALLFDTGMGIGSIGKQVESITTLPITVLNSHCHFDHIGGNFEFKNILLFNNFFAKQNANKGYSRNILKKQITQDKFFINTPKEFNNNKYQIKPFKWHNVIHANKKIMLEPFSFKVINTPGHSPDSICLYEEKFGYLFSGDTIYLGPIYLQFKESSTKEYKKSINKLKNLKNIKVIFPGHNNFTCKPSIINQIYKILKKIKKYRSPQQIKIKGKLSLLLK